MSTPSGSRWLHQLVLALAYVASGIASFAVGLVTQGHAAQTSIVWLPPGVALAFSLLAPGRSWPGIWAGALVLELGLGLLGSAAPGAGLRLLLALTLSGSRALQAEVTARLVHRHAGRPLVLDTLRSVLAYVLCCLFGSLTASTVSNLSLLATGVRHWDHLALDWGSWWVSDAVSSLLFTPALLAWLAEPASTWRTRKACLSVPLLFAVGVVAIEGHRHTALFERELSRRELDRRPDSLPESVHRSTDPRVDAAHDTAQLANRGALSCPAGLTGLVSASLLCGLLLTTTGKAARVSAQVADRTEQLSQANRQLREEIETHRLTERALQESELRWQFALEEASEGVWDWNLRDDSLFWSPRLLAVLGYGPGELVPSFQEWPRMVHPEDLPPIEQALNQHLKGATPSFEGQLRMRRKNGSWVWFETHAKVVARDSEGKPLRMIGTQVDISSRKLAEQALEAHRQQLEIQVKERTVALEAARTTAENASLAKSVFLANMSHELRTPLHAILAYGKLGIEREQSGRSREFFSRIVVSAERLLLVLNDLLDLSRLEAGKTQLQRSRCVVHELVENVVTALGPILGAKRLSLRVDRSECRSSLAVVDRTLMTQVFQNVLTNAARFSGEGGQIDVRIRDTELRNEASAAPALAITVSDLGIGIPEGELEKIFDSFTQSSKTATKAGGTGLGLAICRRLLTLHGGSIVAHNNEGPGATFVITIPIDPLERSDGA